MNRKKACCPACQSDVLVDAFARWCEYCQEFELNNTLDTWNCENPDCDWTGKEPQWTCNTSEEVREDLKKRIIVTFDNGLKTVMNHLETSAINPMVGINTEEARKLIFQHGSPYEPTEGQYSGWKFCYLEDEDPTAIEILNEILK